MRPDQLLQLILTGTLLLFLSGTLHSQEEAKLPRNYVAGSLVQLNDDGAWSWFMDERAIVNRGRLIVGSVRSVGSYDFAPDDPNRGNVEIASYHLPSGRVGKTILHPRFQQDDHNNPAFLALPDGRYLAVYSRHAVERKVFIRFSEPGDPLKWGPPKVFETPGSDRRYAGDNVTYSNLFLLQSGRILKLFRGFSHDPNYMYSDDGGESWEYGGRLLEGRDGYSPYLKYAFDGEKTIHFVVTEDHPRNYDNSLYHGFIRDGSIFHSSGEKATDLSSTTDAPIAAWELTRIFQGDPDNVAWMTDIELDEAGRPHVAFSVQKDGRDLPPRQGGFDHRYFHARWTGTDWIVNEMAYAGTRLYSFEDDYTGLASLDPKDPFTIYISTDAHPVTGEPLMSSGDGDRHYEIFQGRSEDQGETWSWRAITANSTFDNLRPLVPRWNDPRTALIWMRGTYLDNHGEWDTAVVGMILPPSGGD